MRASWLVGLYGIVTCPDAQAGGAQCKAPDGAWYPYGSAACTSTSPLTAADTREIAGERLPKHERARRTFERVQELLDQDFKFMTEQRRKLATEPHGWVRLQELENLFKGQMIKYENQLIGARAILKEPNGY